MGVRRRAVRERLERAAEFARGSAVFAGSLARMKRVVDEAIAEGLATLTPEEFGERLRAVEAEGQHVWVPPKGPVRWEHCGICLTIRRKDGKNSPCRGEAAPITLRDSISEGSAE